MTGAWKRHRPGNFGRGHDRKPASSPSLGTRTQADLDSAISLYIQGHANDTLRAKDRDRIIRDHGNTHVVHKYLNAVDTIFRCGMQNYTDDVDVFVREGGDWRELDSLNFVFRVSQRMYTELHMPELFRRVFPEVARRYDVWKQKQDTSKSQRTR